MILLPLSAASAFGGLYLAAQLAELRSQLGDQFPHGRWRGRVENRVVLGIHEGDRQGRRLEARHLGGLGIERAELE